MNQKANEFPNNDLKKLLATKEAMALVSMLRQMDTSALSRAASLASQGNSSEAKKVLEPILEDPKIRELIQRLEEQNG